MFAKERQNEIYQLIQKDGAVTTSALVNRFGVSIESIRRDLLDMEKQGLLSRVHGGAIAKGEMKPYYDLRRRNEEFSDQKKALARRAAALVCEGEIIGIDTGSTALAFAQALKERFSQLTVVTHSLDVFNCLRDHQSFSVILCGGHYLQDEKAFCGPLTLQMLAGLHMSKAFICPSAISLEFGICDYHSELFQIQQQLMRCADSICILADSSKFEKKALLKLSDAKPEFTYVTDSSLGQQIETLYTENGLQLLH